MESTTIVLIIIFAICGLVLIWAFKNGNNLKLKKKEKKQRKKKTKDSKKEEFKEIIPKEKKEKTEKKKEVIRESVKDEKSGKVEPPTNKISKITKEDFENNNIAVPKTLGGEEKPKTQTKETKLSDKDLGLPPLNGFGDGGFNFDDDFLKDDLMDFGIKSEDFLGPIGDGNLMGDSFMSGNDMDLGEIPMMDFNNFPAPIDMPTRTPGEIRPETIEQRLEKVFGSTLDNQPGVKEVMVGEILSGNRSRVNRELREKRKKWMK